MTDTKSKHCISCGELKALTSFYKKKDTKDGRRKMCVDCSLAEREQRKELCRKIVLEHLANNPCIECGEEDCRALTFDHVRSGKTGDVNRLVHNGVKPERLLAEIALCVVRCSSCHAIKTAREGNYYTHKYIMKQLEERAKKGSSEE